MSTMESLEMSGSASDETCLFVGDLARETTEKILFDEFSRYGDVVRVEIKRDKYTQNNLGYGFVQFVLREDAVKAMNELHGKEICSRHIRIGWAQKNTNLFVFDLEDNPTLDKLIAVFEEYGPLDVSRTFIVHGIYGAVRFLHRGHAELAKASLDGKVIDPENYNKPCRVSWGDSNTQYNCVHVQFDATNVADLSDETICNLFAKFGDVVKVSIPRFSSQSLKGFAFIHFEDSENGEISAAKAIKMLEGSSLTVGESEIVLHCNFGKKQQRRRQRHRSYRYPEDAAFHFPTSPMFMQNFWPFGAIPPALVLPQDPGMDPMSWGPGPAQNPSTFGLSMPNMFYHSGSVAFEAEKGFENSVLVPAPAEGVSEVDATDLNVAT